MASLARSRQPEWPGPGRDAEPSRHKAAAVLLPTLAPGSPHAHPRRLPPMGSRMRPSAKSESTGPPPKFVSPQSLTLWSSDCPEINCKENWIYRLKKKIIIKKEKGFAVRACAQVKAFAVIKTNPAGGLNIRAFPKGFISRAPSMVLVLLPDYRSPRLSLYPVPGRCGPGPGDAGRGRSATWGFLGRC